jgi:hypothetical protein
VRRHGRPRKGEVRVLIDPDAPSTTTTSRAPSPTTFSSKSPF